MKLNFWQWVGVALLAVALVVYFTWDKPRRDRKKEGAPSGNAGPVPMAPLFV
jgi:hypothetical protein